jgi:endonuclease YncB( thermonuclease family)
MGLIRGRKRLTLWGLIKTVLGLLAVYYIGGQFLGEGTGGKRERPDRDIAGAARIVDGDTIELRGEKLRLLGIDAPEMAQTCEAKGKEVRCGKLAAEHLDELIGSRTLNCAIEGKDRYGRGLARCRADGRDIAEDMTRDGWALSDRRYSDGRYHGVEATARASRRGIWAMEFEDPAKWRARRRDPSGPGATGGI